MTAKVVIDNLDNLIGRYLAGETVGKLASEFGVSPQTVTRNLEASGVYQNRRSHQAVIIDEFAPWVARYLVGESENSLAKELGVGRFAFRSNLMRHGVVPRGQSEAETVKWQRMNTEARMRQVAPAHRASRGRVVSLEEAIRYALRREQTASKATAEERQLADWIANAGYHVTIQKAVGRYNLDIAIHTPSIAVEVFGGHWHMSGDHARRFFERTEYILNSGWNMFIIWTDNRRYPLDITAAEYVIRFCQELSGNPSAPRQYRVILGNGQDAPALGAYFNDPPIVEAFRSIADLSGH